MTLRDVWTYCPLFYVPRGALRRMFRPRVMRWDIEFRMSHWADPSARFIGATCADHFNLIAGPPEMRGRPGARDPEWWHFTEEACWDALSQQERDALWSGDIESIRREVTVVLPRRPLVDFLFGGLLQARLVELEQRNAVRLIQREWAICKAAGIDPITKKRRVVPSPALAELKRREEES